MGMKWLKALWVQVRSSDSGLHSLGSDVYCLRMNEKDGFPPKDHKAHERKTQFGFSDVRQQSARLQKPT